MSKFEKGELVQIKATGKIVRITRVLPHPVAPDWLVSPNYLIRVNGKNEVFKKRELRKVR